MDKAMPEVDAFGVDAAAGAEEVEVTWMLAGSILKPGGGGTELGNRDTPVAMPAGTYARGAPRRLERRSWAVGLAPKVEILGRGATIGGVTMGETGGATVVLHYGCCWCTQLPRSCPTSQETASGCPLAPEDVVAQSSCKC